MRISVEKHHIRMARRDRATVRARNAIWESSLRCPISLALREKGFRSVQTSYTYVKTSNGLYRLPKEARDFIVTFDSWRSRFAKPFSFDIERPYGQRSAT